MSSASCTGEFSDDQRVSHGLYIYTRLFWLLRASALRNWRRAGRLALGGTDFCVRAWTRNGHRHVGGLFVF